MLVQVGRLPVRVLDGVIPTHEGECRLVVEVLPLAPHRLMRLGEPTDGLTAPVAAFLAPGYPTLAFGQVALGFAVVARCEDACPIRQRGEGLQPQVYACLLPGWGKRVCRYLGT